MMNFLKRKLEGDGHESDKSHEEAPNVDSLLAENKILRTRVKNLERELAAAQNQLKENTVSSTPIAEIPVKDLDAQVSSMQKIIVKGIKNQMIWKPSCKKGSALWSWEGMMTFPVLLAILKLDSNTKMFAMKKISLDEFQGKLGHITQSIRYGSLQLNGENVIVRFNADTGEAKISGRYGL